MTPFKPIILVFTLLLCSTVIVAQTSEKKEKRRNNMLQDTVVYKNVIGIDVAYILTLLGKKNESYLINYKRHLSKKSALRTGLNFEWSTAKDGHKGVGVKVGYEHIYPIVSYHWKIHWAVDASFQYLARNFQPNKSYRCGISPAIGFSYYPVRRFSISTEICVNFYNTTYRNPESFDPRDNANVWDINIGSVGMLIISYHF